MKYKITKTIDLPEYAVFDIPVNLYNGIIKYGGQSEDLFKLIPDRDDLTDDQIYYQSEFGWKLVVDYITLRVLSPPSFQGKRLREYIIQDR